MGLKAKLLERLRRRNGDARAEIHMPSALSMSEKYRFVINSAAETVLPRQITFFTPEARLQLLCAEGRIFGAACVLEGKTLADQDFTGKNGQPPDPESLQMATAAFLEHSDGCQVAFSDPGPLDLSGTGLLPENLQRNKDQPIAAKPLTVKAPPPPPAATKHPDADLPAFIARAENDFTDLRYYPLGPEADIQPPSGAEAMGKNTLSGINALHRSFAEKLGPNLLFVALAEPAEKQAFVFCQNPAFGFAAAFNPQRLGRVIQAWEKATSA